MFGSGVLDVAIGLIFVFLVVSLLVTTANEFIIESAETLSNFGRVKESADLLRSIDPAELSAVNPLTRQRYEKLRSTLGPT